MIRTDILLRIINILFHVLILSIIQPLFFFKFEEKLESKQHDENVFILENQFSSLFETIKNHIKINQNISTDFFQSILNQQYKLKQSNKKKRIQENHKLIQKSIWIVWLILIIALLFTSLALFQQTIINWETIVFDNLIIFPCIFLYHIYFYYEVAYKYKSSSESEDFYKILKTINGITKPFNPVK